MTVIGIKTTETIYTYPLIGMRSILCLNKSNCNLYIFDKESGMIISETHLDYKDVEKVDFEAFIVMAKEIFTRIINLSN
jgi:hypothetical protein